MTAAKIAITLENDMVKRIDMLVKSNFFPNRSKAIQEAVAEKLNRIEKSLLAQECAKLDPEFELYTVINDYLADVKLNMPTALNFAGLFQNEIDQFVDVISGKAETKAPAQDGIEIMKILDAIYKSAETKHEIILK